MPLYEFRCESCGHEMETIVAFSDPLPTTCDACGGTLKKLLAAPAVQFKGSGFYLTDYGKSGSAAAKEKGGSAESKPAGELKSSGEAAGGGSSAAGTGGDAKPTG